MGTLCTFSCSLISHCQYQSASTKRPLSCHHKILNQRCRMELHGIGKAPQIQDMGTAPFSREELGRRPMLMFPLLGLGIESFIESLKDKTAIAADFADSKVFYSACLVNPVPALRGKDYGKTKMRYPDYTETESGLQYKDLRTGDGPMPKIGDLVVVDWDGYTIGYYGRIFEARNKTKGGSFEGNEKDYFKFRLGSKQVIPAFEEAIASMAVGGIRRVIVPPELGYPGNDFNNAGPRPTTFSGERALDFVLKNQGLIDKTLLFDIELLKVISG